MAVKYHCDRCDAQVKDGYSLFYVSVFKESNPRDKDVNMPMPDKTAFSICENCSNLVLELLKPLAPVTAFVAANLAKDIHRPTSEVPVKDAAVRCPECTAPLPSVEGQCLLAFCPVCHCVL